MEFQGHTPIDTIYEFVGISVGHHVSEYLIWNGWFVGMIVAAALLRLFFLGTHKGTFVEMAGVKQAGPSPRFSRSTCEIQRPPPHPGQHTDEGLAAWGFTSDEIQKLRNTRAIA